MPQRVVITGVGVISSHGNTLDEIGRSLSHPPCFSPSPHLPEVLTRPIGDFNLKSILGRNKNSRYLNRGAAFAVGAAYQAMIDSSLSDVEKRACGLFMGAGPNLDIEGEFPNLVSSGIDWENVPALWILKFLPNTATSLTAQILGVHGENSTLTTACSAGLQAIGEAYRKIKDGYLTHALAGAGDSRLSGSALRAYQKAGALFSPAEKTQPYIPFAPDRCGFIPGEGGAMFLLESLESAEARGADRLGEICGYGASLDGDRMTAPEVSGTFAEQAVQFALKESNLTPDQVDWISSHGTGTVLNDAMESEMLSRVFAPHNTPVTAFKSYFGHLSAACGAMELAAVLACLKTHTIPAIPHLKEGRHGGLNFVKDNIPMKADTVLLENFGFGGQNSAMVVKRWNP